MARIAGVNLPTNKRLEIALRYIYGIGPANSLLVCQKAGISPDVRVNKLTEEEVSKLREIISNDYTVEGDLKRTVYLNIKRLMDLGSYRGLRHIRKLPTRGQRTHSNARTRKGPAVAIAGKKSS